jgi:Lipopolysaccharide kinase (Kdo/WaaP) family
LQKNQLDTFDKVWNQQVNWFEEPNERRGGWSGVGRIELTQADGSTLGGFLKKQDKHCRTSFLHPIKGVPTFQREFEMMQYLAKMGVRAPEVMLFARNPNGDLKTTLLTKELAGFVPLEELTEQMFANGRAPFAQQRLVIKAVAVLARQLHVAKVQHRSFYPKHIFVNLSNNEAPQVAVIDLEKSRINSISILRSIMDLSVLNRHAKHWSKSRRMYFYLQYLGLKRLTPYAKWLCRRILKRSNRVKHK